MEEGSPWQCAFANTIIVLNLDDLICQIKHTILLIYLLLLLMLKFSLYQCSLSFTYSSTGIFNITKS